LRRTLSNRLRARVAWVICSRVRDCRVVINDTGPDDRGAPAARRRDDGNDGDVDDKSDEPHIKRSNEGRAQQGQPDYDDFSDGGADQDRHAADERARLDESYQVGTSQCTRPEYVRSNRFASNSGPRPD
jgi:hypothetical protein